MKKPMTPQREAALRLVGFGSLTALIVCPSKDAPAAQCEAHWRDGCCSACGDDVRVPSVLIDEHRKGIVLSGEQVVFGCRSCVDRAEQLLKTFAQA